jgi:hypothetical protein
MLSHRFPRKRDKRGLRLARGDMEGDRSVGWCRARNPIGLARSDGERCYTGIDSHARLDHFFASPSQSCSTPQGMLSLVMTMW